MVVSNRNLLSRGRFQSRYNSKTPEEVFQDKKLETFIFDFILTTLAEVTPQISPNFFGFPPLPAALDAIARRRQVWLSDLSFPFSWMLVVPCSPSNSPQSRNHRWIRKAPELHVFVFCFFAAKCGKLLGCLGSLFSSKQEYIENKQIQVQVAFPFLIMLSIFCHCWLSVIFLFFASLVLFCHWKHKHAALITQPPPR